MRQSGSKFVLDSRVPRVAANNGVVIGATFKHNQVTGNTVSAGTVGIMLYGMAFGNSIQSNVVDRGGIKVESIDNLIVADGCATGTYGRAPCGYNMVRDNIVSRGSVSLEYCAIPIMDGHANSYAPYISVGNNVIGNRCLQVEGNNQICYVARNTGRRSFRHVTLRSAMMLP